MAASGMSREAYCLWHGLSRSTLYRWERRLRVGSSRLDACVAFEQMEWIAIQAPDPEVARQSALRSLAGC
jgi:transposase-like protein